MSKAYVVVSNAFRYNDEGYDHDGEFDEVKATYLTEKSANQRCQLLNEEFIRKHSKAGGKYGSQELAMHIQALGYDPHRLWPKLFSDWSLKRDLTEFEITTLATHHEFFEVVEVDLYE